MRVRFMRHWRLMTFLVSSSSSCLFSHTTFTPSHSIISASILTPSQTEKARWAVTNRTNVAKILDSTGTSITTKGSFYPAGKEPGPTENPKLYILVEGDTEVVVHDAMRELMRLLKDGTVAAAESDGRATTGRYSVV